MKLSREDKIINTLMIVCIITGFLCFVLILMPASIDEIGGNHTVRTNKATGDKNLSSIIDINTGKETDNLKIEIKRNGMIARFVPERLPNTIGQKYETAKDNKVNASYGKNTDENTTSAKTQQDENDNSPKTIITQRASSITHRHYRKSSLVTEELLDRRPYWIVKPPAELSTDIKFWKNIYSKYDSNQVVLHHPKYLSVVYNVIDLSDINRDASLTDIEKSYRRKKRIEAKKREIINALHDIARYGRISKLTPEERRIKLLFYGIHEKDLFKKAADEYGIRGQSGQRDKFMAALKISGKYLGEIESIFHRFEVPTALTCLIFVESMFNEHAKSQVGAAGIWQFMNGTGKLYLRINDILDERLNPIAASRAAAELLRKNYNELKTWPLAINAYNSGLGRLKQAVKKLGTKKIDRIIRYFNHESYQFASRNFFSEFIAAYDVAEHAKEYFRHIDYDKPLAFDEVRLSYHISLPETANLANIPMDAIRRLNPEFTADIMNGRILLPMKTPILVPLASGERLADAAIKAPKSKRGDLKYMVKRGDTRAYIAAMYGITQDELMQANPNLPTKPRRGIIITIPFKSQF